MLDIDIGSLRVGSEQYAEANGNHGLAALLCSHATVSGDTVSLNFPAKSGQEWQSEITDADLATGVRALKRRGPNARLLARKDGSSWHPVVAADINAYVKERTGGEFTAKDLRTIHGTVAAATSLAKHGAEQRKAARDRALAQAMRDAARVLGNTPSIAKKSYVDPRLVDHYRAGIPIYPARVSAAESELRILLFE